MNSNPGQFSRWRRSLVLSAAFLLIASPALAQQAAVAKTVPAALSSAEKQAASGLTTTTIQKLTADLSDKGMEGRGTATAGGDRAAKYIADRLAALKVRPLGDNGTYLQAINFKSTQVSPETSLKVGETAFKFGRDFIIAPPFTTDSADAAGGIVFAGYGVKSAELNRDDFADIDVTGKIVVLMGGRPTGVDEEMWKKASNPSMKIAGLLQRGAVGIILTNVGNKDQPYSLIADYLSRRSVALGGEPEMPFKLPPILIASNETAAKIVSGSEAAFAELKKKAEAGEFVSKAIDTPATITLRLKREAVVGSNVVGVIDGSDPKLKEEAIVYSAHYDAWGLGNQGEIYAGAADNALGVGEIIAIAEAISKMQTKPKRSVIFLAVTGEEHGLLGAEYWVKHPTWPIEKVAADLNYDGIGTEVYGPVKKIVGFGMEHSSLGGTLEGVTKMNGTLIAPDPMPEEKAFYRSDHYAFVKRGVPALMLMGMPDGDVAVGIARARKWIEVDYHKAGDIIRPDWNWEGARKVAEVGLLVGLRVANDDVLPTWVGTSPFNKDRGYAGPPPPEK